MGIDYQILGPGDASVLHRAPPGLFDFPIDSEQTAAFLGDPRHEIIVAIDAATDRPIAFVSANGYLHPDKPPQAWINELATLEAYRGRGIGTALVRRMLGLLAERGYRQAWLATEHDNAAARAVYRKILQERGGSEDPAVVVYEYPLKRADNPGARGDVS
ncbi:MAG: GNAT family N-acetyltransferase [Phycisphaerales bacterium]|jgi:ribosomal protein S18 acetylase RimI-like enzyme